MLPEGEGMKYLPEYLRKIWKVPALFAVCAGIMAAVLELYALPAEAVLYGAVLCSVAGLASFFYGYVRYRRKRRNLTLLKEAFPVSEFHFPRPGDKVEELYQGMLLELDSLKKEAMGEKSRFYRDLTDYYTMWVHQIKTPIAAMRLILQERDDFEGLQELFKIEQYVEMVLGYLRTEDISSDMHFNEYSLDEIIRDQIHKFAGVFVRKKLALEYEETDALVLTDAKWLGFVIGQVLSNSLKYTKTGRISIFYRKESCTLVMEDTGIGVAPEDLPRVFERGFTGYNGREEGTSTGIGLYLSAKIMGKLGHKISMESQPGKGTRVLLELGREQLNPI